MLMLLLPVPLVAVAGIDAVARASLPSAVSVLFRLDPDAWTDDMRTRPSKPAR
ncbi:hypothetical protein [Xanthomonas campestris]|uniref:hypothetical protein n=1 Tax=Xanthomonas TaxID=338 RepID=UPI001E2BCBC7|nr:hypothetical protein [Xanthomonas campestris]MCC5090483.1 hypothetical protein [Xanthomonas campestris]